MTPYSTIDNTKLLVNQDSILLTGTNPITAIWNNTTTHISWDNTTLTYDTNGRKLHNNLDKKIITKISTLLPQEYNFMVNDRKVISYFVEVSSDYYAYDNNKFDSASDIHTIGIKYSTHNDITIAELTISRSYDLSSDYAKINATYIKIIKDIDADCIVLDSVYPIPDIDIIDSYGVLWKSNKYYKPTYNLIKKIIYKQDCPKIRKK